MKQYNFVVVEIDAGTSLAERTAYAAAQQDQVNLDFGPAWEFPLSTTFRVASSQTDVLPGEVEVRLIDKPTMDGAIGYHDQKADGTPIIYVFVGLAKSLGQEWTTCASHEVLEVLGDPRLRLCVEMADGTIWDHEVCFAGDTKVSLLDGTEVPIMDLVGRPPFWVYSCTPNGDIQPGKAHSVKKTGREETLVVELDNGETITCTPDHLFMLRNSTYARASDLVPGTSLMPLYRQRVPLPGAKSEYEQVLNPSNREWKWTHRVVGIVSPDCALCTPNNHKVIRVRSGGEQDVYDFTVEKHRNFALSAGVFVHNCDRVEALAYQRNGVWLSNFNTPQAFEPDPTPQPGTKYDFMGASTSPNQTLPGGYSQQFDTNKGWTQHVLGELSPYRQALLDMGIGRTAKRLRRNPSLLLRVWRRIKRIFR